MNVVLIYNPKSGGSYNLRQLRKLCDEAGVTISYSFPITDLGSRKLTSLILHGVTVAAVGGDGTMNSVAAKIVGSPSTLLPLPGGTLNHFSKDIGVASSVEAVFKNIKKGKKIDVDVAYLNDQLFVNNSSIGLYPLSLLEQERVQRLFGKWPVAIWAGTRQFIKFRRYRLVVDGVKLRTPFVFVGNNNYKISGGGIPMRSHVSKGVLSVIVATATSRGALLGVIVAVFVGKAHRIDEFDKRTTKKLRIDSSRNELAVSFDGEVACMKPPLLYTVKPGALQVLCVPDVN